MCCAYKNKYYICNDNLIVITKRYEVIPGKRFANPIKLFKVSTEKKSHLSDDFFCFAHLAIHSGMIKLGFTYV